MIWRLECSKYPHSFSPTQNCLDSRSAVEKLCQKKVSRKFWKIPQQYIFGWDLCLKGCRLTTNCILLSCNIPNFERVFIHEEPSRHLFKFINEKAGSNVWDLFKVNNIDTRTTTSLTFFGVLMVNLEQISHIVLVFALLTLNI